MIDLRMKKTVETDDGGVLRIKRRKASSPVEWRDNLNRLIAFLDCLTCPEVTVTTDPTTT